MIGVAGDLRKKVRYKRPDSGLKGWAAAWTLLELIDDDQQRELLGRLVRSAGFQGAPALKYFAARLRYIAGIGDYPEVPGMLGAEVVAQMDRRVVELLRPHGAVFPKMRDLP